MRLILFILLVCFSVQADNANSWVEADNVAVLRFLKDSFPKCDYGIQPTSQSYCIPTIDWINKVYTPYLKEFLGRNQVLTYLDPENNCVKFSTYALAAGYLLHYKQSEGLIKTSLAIGILDYYVTKKDAHSINIFVASDNGKLVIVYYEPQNQIIKTNLQISRILSLRM